MKPGYHDEPRFFLCSASLNIKASREISASGLSFSSRQLAVLKCLGESIERYCAFSSKYHSKVYRSFDELSDKYALNPELLDNNPQIRFEKLSWVRGSNLTNDVKAYIPSQMVLQDYKRRKNEKVLRQPNVSTGSAGGFDHESTLLRGIYEVIERDSFMNIYLNKIRAPKIDLSKIKNQTVQRIVYDCIRYNLDVNVVKVETDLGVPSFFGIVTDKTGIGPAVSCGAKASLNSEEALIGAVSEAFLTRGWLRLELLKQNYKYPKDQMKPQTLMQRGLLWASPKMLDQLDFLLNQTPVQYALSNFKGGAKDELGKVISLLKEKGHTIYYVDLTLPEFRKIGYFVYKVVIPTLQPLYLDERYKVYRTKRLSEVAKFYGVSNASLNKVPHPFL